MWAVVLVPMWLRRHDAATESRSVDRFSTAMRVLSRRSSGGPDRRYVLMPKRDARATVPVSRASPTPRPPTPQAPAAPPPRPPEGVPTRTPWLPPRPPPPAARRRRPSRAPAGPPSLLSLRGAPPVCGGPLHLVVDLTLAAFVVPLRRRGRRAGAVPRQRRRAAVAPASPAPAAS